MPCVCLANTFARWKSLKAQNSSASKVDASVSAPAPVQQPAAAELLADGAVIKVPHERKTFQPVSPGATAEASAFAGSTSGITQPIFLHQSAKNRKQLWLLGRFRRTQRVRTSKTATAPAINFGRSAVRMTRADLINAESRLGSTIFGPIPAGHRREFFHDRNNVWIWHEDWCDGQNNPHQMTVRYEVRTSGIYKKVASGKYLKLEGDELENFRKATHAYLYVIKKNLYNRPRIAFSGKV